MAVIEPNRTETPAERTAWDTDMAAALNSLVTGPIALLQADPRATPAQSGETCSVTTIHACRGGGEWRVNGHVGAYCPAHAAMHLRIDDWAAEVTA